MENTNDTQNTSNDRLWAALSWIPITPLWPILAVLAIVLDETKDRAYVRYNAVLSIATGVVLIPLTIITCGLAGLVYLVFFYWAYEAYQGKTVEIPVLSDWIRQQGWVS